MRILQMGGNAADSAVATAAALNVTEPTSTGIGGDCFALFFNSNDKKVHGVNGSGRAPAALTLTKVKEDGFSDTLDPFHPHTVTVPGAAAGWIDTIEKHGILEMDQILQPAIELARDGFPVSDLTARSWEGGMSRLKASPNGNEMLLNGRAPKAGEMMRNTNLATTFLSLIQEGKSGFYEGRIAQAIVDLLSPMGGVMTTDDLKNHKSSFDKPISVNYHGVDVYEIPPNGQGITALIALNILEEFNLKALDPLGPTYLHILIEAMRIAFADTRYYVADPSVTHIPIKELLSKSYAAERRKQLNPKKATIDVTHGSPVNSSDTVYLSVVDGDGNACSFINSNYMGFGTGLIPLGCGFTLQNRGHNFSLDADHPNVIAPNKRPYHTIIPAMATKDTELFASFGVMGGFMQPQGHVQVISNLVNFSMNPQQALDHPRFNISTGYPDGMVALEDGISLKTMESLTSMGHSIEPITGYRRQLFGRGQIILRDPKSGVLTAGSDARADGMAIGW